MSLTRFLIFYLISESHSFMLSKKYYIHSSEKWNLYTVSTSGMWNSGLSFGKGTFRFYKSFDDWMAPFPQEDKKDFPELFNLPKGVYEVSLPRPLGLIFEEVDIGRGVYVKDLVDGGNAQRQGLIQTDDVLVGVTAIKVIGAKWERRLIPAINLNFDTVLDAIGSNEERWGCQDVVLMFARKNEAEYNQDKVDAFFQFFNPPGDSPWRTG